MILRTQLDLLTDNALNGTKMAINNLYVCMPSNLKATNERTVVVQKFLYLRKLFILYRNLFTAYKMCSQVSKRCRIANRTNFTTVSNKPATLN